MQNEGRKKRSETKENVKGVNQAKLNAEARSFGGGGEGDKR